jgi:Glycosyl hydrolase family 63 N-terminal domain
LDSYTWTQYDPREGGVQEIKDGKNNVKITTEFLKVPGGRHGGSWAARVKGEPIDPCECSCVVVVNDWSLCRRVIDDHFSFPSCFVSDFPDLLYWIGRSGRTRNGDGRK